MNINDIPKHAFFPAIKARFERRFSSRKRKGCWEWRGAKKNQADRGTFVVERYGWMSVDDQGFRAHRLSWVFYRGPIPDGLGVLHKCDNPCCVNPDHLFIGSQADNVRDMIEKGRKVRLSGDNAANRKLSSDDVMAIRRSKESTIVLAERYGVTRTNISAIQLGQTWKGLPGARSSTRTY